MSSALEISAIKTILDNIYRRIATEITSSQLLDLDTLGNHYFVTIGGSDIVLDLPPAANFPDEEIYLRRRNNGSKLVTIIPDGTDNFDDDVSLTVITLATKGQYVKLKSNGVDSWEVLDSSVFSDSTLTGEGTLSNPLSIANLSSESFDANDAIYPSTNPAVADSRNGHPVISFDDIVAEKVLFNSSMMGNYDGADILIHVDWVAETAVTTGGVTWGIEIERNAPGGTDIDSDSFATQQTGTSTTNGTSGIITRTTITLTQAEADAIEALDLYRMRVQRVVGDAGDTMVNDAQIIGISWSINNG